MSNIVEQTVTEFRRQGSGAQTRGKILFVLVIFVVETILQILYLAFKSKYLDHYLYATFGKLLVGAAVLIGGIKLLFFLPVYLFLHLVNLKRPVSRLKTAFYHTAAFLTVFLCIAMVWSIYGIVRISDVLLFTSFSFVSAFLFFRKSSFQ